MTNELPDVLPARHPDVEVAEFDTEYVVFDPRCSEVHLLTGLTAVVFDACDGATPVSTVVDELVDELRLPEQQGGGLVREALAELTLIGALTNTAPTPRPP